LLEEGRSLEEARKEAEANDRRVVEFARGVEVMIADAAYTADEYPAKIGYGHSSVDDVLQRALDAQVRQVVLTHHDMTHSDDMLDQLQEYASEFLQRAGVETKCVLAREGLEIDV
jgi:ribonuclease BN (tRNA processing enzyme)